MGQRVSPSHRAEPAVPAEGLLRRARRAAGASDCAPAFVMDRGVAMDHYIPKRRIPVTLWVRGRDAVAAHLFLDIQGERRGTVTLLSKLNESAPFLVTAVGPEGRIHLVHKSLVV